jgi:hypothetical protein
MSIPFHEAISTASLDAGLPLYNSDEFNDVLVEASIATFAAEAPDFLAAAAHSTDNSYPKPHTGIHVQRTHLTAIESTLSSTVDEHIIVGSVALLSAITSQRGCESDQRTLHDLAMASEARNLIIEQAFNEKTLGTYSGTMARFLIENWAGAPYSHSEVGFLLKLASDEAQESINSKQSDGYQPYKPDIHILTDVPKIHITQEAISESLRSLDWIKPDLLPLSLPAKLVHAQKGAALIVNLCEGNATTHNAEQDVIMSGMHDQALRYIEHDVHRLVNHQRVKSFLHTSVPIYYRGNVGRNNKLLRTFVTHLTQTQEGTPIYGIVGLARTKANELKVTQLFTKNRLTSSSL